MWCTKTHPAHKKSNHACRVDLALVEKCVAVCLLCVAMAEPFHQPTFYLGGALVVELDDGGLRFVVGG